MEDRAYQLRALDGCRAAYGRGARRVLLVSPTGSGKTTMASQVVKGAVAKGRRVLWLAHRDELIAQAHERISQEGIACGYVKAGRPSAPELPVQVASVQTLASRGVPGGPWGLMVIDEAHRTRAATYEEIIRVVGNATPILGLTATPWRSDGLGLGDAYQESILAATPAELIASGHLVGYDGFTFETPDGKGVLGDIAAKYIEHAAGRRAVAFAINVAHSKAIVAEFLAADISAEHLDGMTASEERKGILSRLASGETLVVSNVGVLCEGWDCLDSETEILTASGWRGMGQVAKGDLVYSLNRNTEKLELVPAEEYGERLTRDNERMLTIESQHANIRTTEGHQFHIKYRDPRRGGALSANFLTKTGTQIANRRSPYSLPIAAEMAEPPAGISLSDDEIRLVAWFMTDGGFVRGQSSLFLYQSKHYHHEIRALLTRIGFDFTERLREVKTKFKSNAPCYEFRVPKGNCTGLLARNGWGHLAPYLSKDVSPLLHGMSRHQFLVFWEEMLKGDGERCDGKSGWLWCDRKEQADAYTQMAVTRGLSSSYSIRVTENNHTMYRVSVRDAQWLTSNPVDERAGKVRLSQPQPGERVWCVRNRNSTIVTRRGGKIAIIGNCPLAEVAIVARSIGKKATSLWLQMIGRVMRPARGKTRARIHDHGGNIAVHGLPDEERDYSLTSDVTRRKRKDAVISQRNCRKCFATWTPPPVACPRCGWCLPAEEIELLSEEDGRVVTIENVKLRAWMQMEAQRVKRNYKPLWSQLEFRKKHGHFPPVEWLGAGVQRALGL